MLMTPHVFWERQAEWSEKTFGNDTERGPVGPLKHLALEVLVELLSYEKGHVQNLLNGCAPSEHEVDRLCATARLQKKTGWPTDKPIPLDADTKKVLYEFADLFFLIVDSARRAGFTWDMLLAAAFAKLAINKGRTWQKPTTDGAVEHVRTTIQPGQDNNGEG